MSMSAAGACRCRSQGTRNPFNCVVPDYLLRRMQEHVIEQGIAPAARAEQDDAARARQETLAKAALETITVNAGLRVERATTARGRRRPPAMRAWRWEAAALDKNRTVFDAHHTQQLPGSRLRGEGDPPSQDVAVNEAYDYAGATLDFYFKSYQRNSIDDRGMPVNSTVHYGSNYDNAMWNGRQMVYGDGDGELFNRFTIDIDVIGHELTHGVTQVEAGLIYQGQPGALNESVSDVFGSLVKQFAANQTADQADWLIGEHLFTDQVDPKGSAALRSMKSPGDAYDDDVLGKDPQPANMKDYVRTQEDSGGVHINSGIPNHAFYLAATAIGGYAWEKAGLIWYETLLSPRLLPGTRFVGFARLTVAVARQLFGPGSAEVQATRDAWREVGVLQAPGAFYGGGGNRQAGADEDRPAARSGGAQESRRRQARRSSGSGRS
jgi:Zn-dependent metalloprotease